MPNDNGNEPSPMPTAPVQPCCGSCKTKPARIAMNPIVLKQADPSLGDLICNVFTCPDCGAIYNIQIVGQTQPLLVTAAPKMAAVS